MPLNQKGLATQKHNLQPGRCFPHEKARVGLNDVWISGRPWGHLSRTHDVQGRVGAEGDFSPVTRHTRISNTWCALVPTTTITSHAHPSEHRSRIPASNPGSWPRQAWDGLEGLQSEGLRGRAGQESPAEVGLGSFPPLLPSKPRTRVGRPAAKAFTARWASRGPAGGEVSPPTPAIGSGEQRGRPEGFFGRARLVI